MHSIEKKKKKLYIFILISLTHWGRVTHICVSKLTIIGSDNGLSPGRRQAIIWTNVGMLLIRPLATNFSENLIRIQTFPFKKMHLKVLSEIWRPFCLGLNVLKFVPECLIEWVTIDSGDGLVSNRHQSITWTNDYSVHLSITRPQWINSLGPCDAIWQCRSVSTLAQAMACCLTASSHYLNQCWLIISKVPWHSYEGNLTLDALAISH